MRAELATTQSAPPSPAHRRAAFDRLLSAFSRQPQTTAAQRWQLLEAAHVLGQSVLALHWQSHVVMLRYALQLRDGREAAGQVLRLALVPLGHLLSRLPSGNIGRSHVPALRPMMPAAEVTALIEKALEDTAPTARRPVHMA